MEGKPKCGLKFQIDSDEDLSDNCGSRSPLLCRHESLEKGSRSAVSSTCDDKSCVSFSRTLSNEENQPQSFKKINRTLSADENVALSKNLKSTKSLRRSEKNLFSSLVLPVYDDRGDTEFKETDDGETTKELKTSGASQTRSCKPIVKRESFLHRHKKLTLSPTINIDNEELDCDIKRLDFQEEKDDFQEKVGLDWLFEHTDSETENPRCKFH